MTAVRIDLVFWKRPFGTDNLAATTEATTPADRVNIHTQNPRGMEQRRINRKAATASRRRENHLYLFNRFIRFVDRIHSYLGSFSTATTNPPFPFGNRLAIGSNPVGTVGIIAHHHVATAHCRHHFCVQWAGDSGGHSCAHCHG